MECLLLCLFFFLTFAGIISSEYGVYIVRCHDDSDPVKDAYCPKGMTCCDNGGCCRNGYTCCRNTCCYGPNCCPDLYDALNVDSEDLYDALNAGSHDLSDALNADSHDLSNALNAASNDHSDALSAGAIVGIVIGSLAEVGLMVAMVIIAVNLKMKKTKVGCVNNAEPHLSSSGEPAAKGTIPF